LIFYPIKIGKSYASEAQGLPIVIWIGTSCANPFHEILSHYLVLYFNVLMEQLHTHFQVFSIWYALNVM
jgi:hypothetical protein